MARRTWKKNEVLVSFSNPSITPHHEEEHLTKYEQVMYFYYQIDILFGKKTVFTADAYDCPKVQYLPGVIDELVNYDMEKAYLMEDYQDNGFSRKVRYYQIKIDEDILGMDVEYGYKFERYDYEIIQRNEEARFYSTYQVTISLMEKNLEGYSNREPYGKAIILKDLDKEDLLRLKQTAEAFIQFSIEHHNKNS